MYNMYVHMSVDTSRHSWITIRNAPRGGETVPTCVLARRCLTISSVLYFARYPYKYDFYVNTFALIRRHQGLFVVRFFLLFDGTSVENFGGQLLKIKFESRLFMEDPAGHVCNGYQAIASFSDGLSKSTT